MQTAQNLADLRAAREQLEQEAERLAAGEEIAYQTTPDDNPEDPAPVRIARILAAVEELATELDCEDCQTHNGCRCNA